MKQTLPEMQFKAFKQLQEFFGAEGFWLVLKNEKHKDSDIEWAIPVAGALYSDEQYKITNTRTAGAWRAAPDLDRAAIESDLKFCAGQQRNYKRSVLFRPVNPLRILMLDDVKDISPHLDRPGRLIICSSPNNFQVWVRFDQDIPDEVLVELFEQYSPDKGAHPHARGGRMPAFRNYKAKYLSNPPLAVIKRRSVGYEAVEGFKATAIKVRDLKPVQEPTYSPERHTVSKFNTPLSWDHFMNLKGDSSEADWCYALNMKSCGYSKSEVERILREEGRPDPEKKDKTYFQRTAERAFAAAGQRREV